MAVPGTEDATATPHPVNQQPICIHQIPENRRAGLRLRLSLSLCIGLSLGLGLSFGKSNFVQTTLPSLSLSLNLQPFFLYLNYSHWFLDKLGPSFKQMAFKYTVLLNYTVKYFQL